MWNENTEAILRKMWPEGYTAIEIAKTIGAGFTKNSIIGKARRLKLGRHDISTRKRAPRAYAYPRKRSPTRKKPTPYNPKNPVPFSELKEGCLYHIGDGLFCSEAREPKSSYCEHHHKICYVRSTYRR